MSEVKKTREEWLEEARKSKGIGGCAFLLACLCVVGAITYIMGLGSGLGALACVFLYISFVMKYVAKDELKKAEEADEEVSQKN